ncbi:MAG: 5'-3' exonuclease H3TH domain-containing protein [Actinomycetota bacterium]
MTLVLIDSASLWYRAYYGMPDTLLSPQGEPINAVKGFLDMTARLVNQYQPDRLVMCLDGDWRPSWRVELFPEYKANRVDDEGDEELEPDLLTPQIPLILDFFEAAGIPLVGIDDYEADDVIATYSKTETGPIRIITGDRDLFQLVDDERNVAVAYLAKGISNHDLVDISWIAEKYGIPGERYALFAMIRGDASDGLPGIRGIGEKGAAAIAKTFSSMDSVIEAAHNGDDALHPTHRKKILADLHYAKIAEKLVSCAIDIRLPSIDLTSPKEPHDRKYLETMKKDYGLGASVDRLLSAFKW